VKFMARQADVVIVVGSPNSSNSNRLREVAAKRGVHAYMIDRADAARGRLGGWEILVGVTAGASAPKCSCRRSSRASTNWARAACVSSTASPSASYFRCPRPGRADRASSAETGSTSD
jgi:4-hydroxy-3-methylbut-2-enyl diphosphate reductase